MRRLDQDQAGWIETEAVEAVAMKPPMGPAVLAQPIGRHDEDERVSPRQAGENRRDEAERGRYGACRRRHDFMQGAAGQAALGQVGIEGGKAKRQGCAQTLQPGQQAAQFCHHGGAVSQQVWRR